MERLASRSMWGVRACGCPPKAPTQSFKSSMAMKSTLGCGAARSVDAQNTRTMMVMMMAMTPSLNASSLLLVMCVPFGFSVEAT